MSAPNAHLCLQGITTDAAHGHAAVGGPSHHAAHVDPADVAASGHGTLTRGAACASLPTTVTSVSSQQASQVGGSRGSFGFKAPIHRFHRFSFFFSELRFIVW